jgi:hypothetical protein
LKEAIAVVPFTLRQAQGERVELAGRAKTVRAEPVEARTSIGTIESRIGITKPTEVWSTGV